MNQHHVSFVPVDDLMSRREALPPEHVIIQEMADALAAGVISANLDLGDDLDVIRCVMDACPKYRSRTINDHLDAAIYLARQIMIAAEMTEG